MTGRTRRATTLPTVVVPLAALALAGCADPRAEQEGDQAPSGSVGSEAPDPARQALADQLDRLTEALTTGREHLRTAADADDVAGARRAADAAVDLLIGEPDEDTPVLFPAETPERGGDTDREDLLTSTLTAAREAGEPGREIQEALRELVAGDLGGWQRDAEGMVAQVRAATTAGGSPDETEQAVFALGGEATRALAWALLAAEGDDLELATTYAARGAAHLEVAGDALAEIDVEQG